MIIKIFGTLDFLTALVILSLQWDFGAWNLGLAGTCYLTLKWFMFRESLQSIFDLTIGIYILLLILGWHSIISYVAAGYLLQKAAISFF